MYQQQIKEDKKSGVVVVTGYAKTTCLSQDLIMVKKEVVETTKELQEGESRREDHQGPWLGEDRQVDIGKCHCYLLMMN